jgi:hypothetical protein
LGWEDLSAVDRRALTEMLVDKIVIGPHPSKIDKDGRRHYTIRAIPYQDPQARGRTSEGGARGSGQDRPQSLSRDPARSDLGLYAGAARELSESRSTGA